ncbi:uncharacterized protein LOC144623545 [Crassostrea virginica]
MQLYDFLCQAFKICVVIYILFGLTESDCNTYRDYYYGYQRTDCYYYHYGDSTSSSSGKTLTGGEIGALCMGIITALVIVFIVYTKWFKKPKKIKPQIIVVAPVDGNVVKQDYSDYI